jgi:hypothetical protein
MGDSTRALGPEGVTGEAGSVPRGSARACQGANRPGASRKPAQRSGAAPKSPLKLPPKSQLCSKPSESRNWTATNSRSD